VKNILSKSLFCNDPPECAHSNGSAENAAQLIAIILSTDECLKKLDQEDIRNLLGDIVSRIEEHFLGIRSLGVYRHAHRKSLMAETS
jgi:hypothetical protein